MLAGQDIWLSHLMEDLMPSGDKELGYGWAWGVFPLHVPCHGRAPVILPRLFTDGETGLREWALGCSCQRERTWGPDPALGLLHRVGGEIHVVLCHWALPTSQVLPAWPVSCPLYPGDQALPCPPFPEGGNAQRDEGTSPWPNRWKVAQVGFERGILRAASRALSAQRGFGCLAEARTNPLDGGQLWDPSAQLKADTPNCQKPPGCSAHPTSLPWRSVGLNKYFRTN